MHFCRHIAGTAARTGPAPRGGHQANDTKGDQQAGDTIAFHLHPELFSLGPESSCDIGRDRKSSKELENCPNPSEAKFVVPTVSQ